MNITANTTTATATTTAVVDFFDILLDWRMGNYERDRPQRCPVASPSRAAAILWAHTKWSPEVISRAMGSMRWPGESGWRNFHPASAERMIDDRLAVIVSNPRAQHRGLFLEGPCRIFGGLDVPPNLIPAGAKWTEFHDKATESARALARFRNAVVKDPLPGDPAEWVVHLLCPQ